MVLKFVPVRQKVFLRGNPNSHGEVVERQFLEVLSGKDRQPFNGKGSGRLALAKAIVEPQNPLVARVLVNRIWSHHFGTGFVDTPSDFGRQGGEASHPELLDYLASELIDNDWSMKRIHRLIVTSATYRRASSVKSLCQIPILKTVFFSDESSSWILKPCAILLSLSVGMDERQGGQSADLLQKPTPHDVLCMVRLCARTSRVSFAPSTLPIQVFIHPNAQKRQSLSKLFLQ